MFLYRLLPGIPLPVISLLLPLIAASIPFALFIYKELLRWHRNEDFVPETNLRFLKLFFIAVLIANLCLTWLVWTGMGKANTELFVLSSGGWSKTLSSESPMLIKTVLQVDVFGALSAFLIGFIAFIAGLAAMADKKDTLSFSKITFFLATLAGIQGIFYSGDVFSLFIFILISQIGASGLFHGIVRTKEELKELIWYYVSRSAVLLMFLAGAALLYYNY